MNTDYETITLQLESGIATLTLNRPDVRNAINLAMVREITGVLDDLAPRDDVGALIVTGAGGKAFAGGADIKELRDRTHRESLQAIYSTLFRKLEGFPHPTIAAVVGYAVGGGCELCLACDLRVAGEGARFGQPEVNLGIMPAAGATQRLPRLIGLGRAKELIFTGEIIDAARALEIGLVNQVVPDGEVMAAAKRLAAKILEKGRLAVRLAKAALNASGGGTPEVGLWLESVSQGILYDTEEKRQRMTDFLEKKKKK
ncbi:MAG: enoyl-CoA hydratase-related protein [Planctomycetota bacterium]|nr:enoyl-CoA hydratase-related protein [Planctomycetota bacterium]